MNKYDSEDFSIKIIEKVEDELRGILSLCSDYVVKEKLHKLLDYIEEETINKKSALEELVYCKVRETKGRNPELNTHFYLLYRNFTQGKISMQEAQRLYDMYVKEY